MRSNSTIMFIALLGISTGIVYYALQQQWIIITLTTHIHDLSPKQAVEYTKKRVTLFMWHLNKWETESIELLWSQHDAHNTQQLIKAILTLASEEHIINKKISVERVLQQYNTNQLLVFFDQTPFSQHMSVRARVMLIESILKTMRENGIQASGIYFLVNNQPLIDQHLDFRQAWPIAGFCAS